MEQFCSECLQPLNASKAGLTPRQRDAMLFIQSAYEATGVGPSYDEIKNGLGLASKSSINRLVVSLEQRGYLGRVSGAGRSIVPLVAVLPADDQRHFERRPSQILDDDQMAEIYDDRTYDDAGAA